MTCAIASGQPSDLARPFQAADTLILDAPVVRAVRDRLELHLLAIEVLRGQGRDHGEAYQSPGWARNVSASTWLRAPWSKVGN